MSSHEEANNSSSNSNNVSFDGNNKPSSPVNHKHSGTFNNDNTDSVDSASGLRHRIFAGNLDFGTTKEQLYDAFSKCGKIVDEIRLHPGYAFIQFESEQACSKAIATLSGTQLCSKRIDVQMAKGPNNSQKNVNSNKRKLDSRDRQQPPSRNNSSNFNNSGDSKNDRYSRGDRDNKNKKQKRTPPRNSQPPLQMPSTTMMPTSSPYSTNSSGVTSVPIYIPDQTLEPFANFVMQTLKSGGLIYHNVHIRNTNQGELFFTSPQFLQLVSNERFVIYIVARHEIARNIVSFKALMPDGTSPGFADTMITDICSFILNAPPPPVPVSNVYQQYSMQYPVVPPTSTPQPSLNIPGLSFGYNPPQQPSQNYNNNRPANQGGNYGNRDNRSSYNNNNNRNNNSRNDRGGNNSNRNDRRDDDRRGNNNNRSNNYNRGGNNNNNYQRDSGSNSDNNEVQGLIIKLLDTINKKPSSSSNSSILLSESANSTTGNDDYSSPSDHHYQ
ncbi:RNA recognition motif-containing protein [Naegleria gruberi]|uniref:RNA recognition motif-containing protein n=1 Tax=Naegleria gruberi TaxID=5762 RepID=D2UYV2_NAEGR|nr:RNA recognition motif-containing protein [Naegleria gruberi]EFC50034.1 RNA recognition motif-containing protein [Naegleria gruberi]|eukprot:XP_002682778.1 RNA recognition motif-containing protein [Naegleria gruberi strain NEG-M]